MPSRAKRFYLCNLIPLWEIDEKGMDVDWPVYHAFFGDLIEMRAEIRDRKIAWSTGDAATPQADLKIRFEVKESDFLLSGGLNDDMGTFSSHAGFGDDVKLRPIRIVQDVDQVPEADREKFIFIHWRQAFERTVTVKGEDGRETTSTEKVPEALEVRCFWKVEEPEGGDVSGSPEYYYDVYLEGKLENGEGVELHERSDNELEGLRWHVTDKVRKGRVEPLVDGEYAYLRMLQMIDGAQSSIHILNWKLDPQATLAIEPSFRADYLQVEGLDPAAYEALLVRSKSRPTGVAAAGDQFLYTATNGNVVAGLADGSSIVTAVRNYDEPTNLDWPVDVEMVDFRNLQFVVLDQLRSRLLLHLVVDRSQLQNFSPEEDRGMYAAVVGPRRAFPCHQIRPSLPFVDHKAELVATLIPIAGDGHAGYQDGGLSADSPDGRVSFKRPVGMMNRPTGVALARDRRLLLITDTGNHCLRRVSPFDPADVDGTLASSDFRLETVAGTSGQAGDADGTGPDARFRDPAGVVWDSVGGRALVADAGNHKIRSVLLPSGETKTLAVTKIDGVSGPLGEVHGLALDPAKGAKGTLYVSERDRHRILEVDLDTLAARTVAGAAGARGYQDGAAAAARFARPLGLALSGGTLLVADHDNRVLRALDLGPGTVRTIGSTTESGVQDVPVVLADALQRKAASGVAVRVLIDSYGAGVGRDEPLASFQVSGLETVADLRFLDPTIRAFVQNHPQTLGDQALASFHEKMMVVDSRIGLAGGIDFAPDKNDGIPHTRRHRSSIPWHDVAAFVEGKAAMGLEEAFLRRWKLGHDENAKVVPAQGELPDVPPAADRTDAALGDDQIETVRTFDPTPLVGFLVNVGEDATREVLESYRRAILGARHYVYMEHQYLYYPEIGEYLEQAMKDNPRLQVIWALPFFTEETREPTQERLRLEAGDKLASSLLDAKEFFSRNQKRTQLAWHGFFRQHEMVEKLRKVDASRFGSFSMRRPIIDLVGPQSRTIYPHSKMILCDDRFFSIGSANANGRGFTKDGELNVSALAPSAAKRLRERLWGEHLGYLGTARVLVDASLASVNGHHLSKGSEIELRHPELGTVLRKVEMVDPASGVFYLEGAPLEASLGEVYWRDPQLSDLPLDDALAFWKRSAHSLATFKKVQGFDGKSNAAGELVIPGHLAQVGDKFTFSERLLRLDDEGKPVASASDGKVAERIFAQLEVAEVKGDAIRFTPVKGRNPATGPLKDALVGSTVDLEPLRLKITKRESGVAEYEVTGLTPNASNIPFDYHLSWLMRQPNGRNLVRAWEVEPLEGIKYAGPGSLLFSPWLAIPTLFLPWIFVDFDVDEQARLDLPGGGGNFFA